MCTLLFANPSDTHREEEEKKKIEASNETDSSGGSLALQ